MIARYCPFEETRARLCIDLFDKCPGDDPRDRVGMAMATPLKPKTSFAGAAAGWAAGIVFAVGSADCGVPCVLNSELEKAFGVTMSTIYKRAWAVKRLLGLCPGL